MIVTGRFYAQPKLAPPYAGEPIWEAGDGYAAKVSYMCNCDSGDMITYGELNGVRVADAGMMSTGGNRMHAGFAGVFDRIFVKSITDVAPARGSFQIEVFDVVPRSALGLPEGTARQRTTEDPAPRKPAGLRVRKTGARSR